MTDQKLETIVGGLLRTGVILSATVVLASGIWYLAVYGASTVHYRVFQPSALGMRLFSVLSPPETGILIGLLILIATPVARVIFAVVAFGLERDGLYVVFTLVVLAILMYSIGTAWM